MKTLIIINCIIACTVLILTLEMGFEIVAQVKKDFPNAKFIEKTLVAKIIGWISIVIRSLIPIYNIIVLIGYLFARDTMIKQGYDILLNRMIRESNFQKGVNNANK